MSNPYGLSDSALAIADANGFNDAQRRAYADANRRSAERRAREAKRGKSGATKDFAQEKVSQRRELIVGAMTIEIIPRHGR